MQIIELNITSLISFSFLIVAFLFAFIRLVKGPTINDRIAAMDLIASIAMGFILVYSILIKESLYIDIAIVISLISFVGTVAISTYLKQNTQGDE
jgi:multicomponent Na+:H+ antiporter subunit F